MPLTFVPNRGQTDERVRFYGRGAGYAFYFTPRSVVLSLARKGRATALALSFPGASPDARLVAGRRGTGTVNDLVGGERRTGLPTYRELTYRGLWPGVDLVFRGTGDKLKYEFRLRPGADPGKVALAYQGADGLAIGPAGNLLISTPLGTLRDARPRSFQRVGGRRVPVGSRYALNRSRSAYGFALGAYDPRRPLVIDPGLSYSTYLGGGSGDEGVGIAVDTSGNAYVTGYTASLDFPATTGAYDEAAAGTDAFVTKLAPTGSGLAYSTYLGGAGSDQGRSIAVDATGNAYVTGFTDSTDFPTSLGAPGGNLAGGQDAFVTKLDAAGSALAYSTYLGGTANDPAAGIAVDGTGSAYVTGTTSSSNFPASVGVADTALGGAQDAYVTKLDAAGATLAYSTYLGGDGNESGGGIAVDGTGSAYVTGSTESGSFPTTTGAHDTSLGGTRDVFATKLNAAATALAYSTYLGGGGGDQGSGIAIDGSGRAHITGTTGSADFPTTAGAHDTTFGGGAPGVNDAFVTRLDAAGAALGYSTYLGGTANDQAGFGIALDSGGSAYVTGTTSSADFPTTADAQDPTCGATDAYVAKLETTGSALAYSTCLGGASSETGDDVAVDGSGHAYVTGLTQSTNFPTSTGAYDTTTLGEGDAFVTKLDTSPGTPTLTDTDPDSPANDNSPKVKGTAQAGSTVKIYKAATTADCTTANLLATGTAAELTSPGIPVSVADNTTTTLRATATDSAGNTSACSDPIVYVEDSAAPPGPTFTDTDPDSPANDNAPKVKGTAQADTTVRLYKAATTADCTPENLVATGTAADFASPGLQVSVADNTTTRFRAIATDAAGNSSPCSGGSIFYVEDSTPPSAPQFTGTDPTSPANNNSPRVKGTAQAGATVNLYKAATSADCTPENLAATGAAADLASPGLQVSVADDATTRFRATATDVAGNTSNCSAGSITYVEDSTPPSAPQFTATDPASPANNNSPLIKGTAQAGSTVTLYKADTPADCTAANLAATGTAAEFSSPGLQVSVADNTTTRFRATATDAAGNTSSCSAGSITYEEDSTAPSAPQFTGTDPTSPANENSPRVKGTAQAGATVSLYKAATSADCTPANLVATGTAAELSSPGLAVSVADDTSTRFRATATDAAGNTSDCSAGSIVYVEDSTPPPGPSFSGTDPASPANNNTPKIKGTAQAGSTVQLFKAATSADCTPQNLVATGTAAELASPGFAVSVADDTSTRFRAIATDVAGNVSVCSAGSIVYVEDSTAPSAPQLTVTDPASPANENAPKVKGIAQGGSTVRLYKADTSSDCTPENLAATGTAAEFISPGLSVSVADDTTTRFRATATDAAGNTSACSVGFITYIEDSTPPALPDLTGTSPASPANDNTPTVKGVAAAGSTVRVYKAATTADCTPANLAATGTEAELGSGLPVSVPDNSTTRFRATATDIAGNVSDCSASSVTYVEDSIAPPGPYFSGTDPTGPANDNSPQIKGTAQVGATVRLYKAATTADCTPANLAGTGTAAQLGSTGLQVSVPDNSTTRFRAVATDTAGNASVCSGGSIFYVEDSMAPPGPSLNATVPGSPANDNSPIVRGAAQPGSTIRLYKAASATDCVPANLAASGTASELGSPGLQVSVPNDTTTRFRAIATDAAGNASVCSPTALTYVEDSTPPPGPTVTDTDPNSPSSDSTPMVKGAAASGTTVRLYKAGTTSDCTPANLAATGTAPQFASPGLQVSVPNDSTTRFRATATDSAGNLSPCSGGSIVYVQAASTAALEIAAAGDIACAPGDPVTADTCREKFTSDTIIRDGAARVLALGDLQYNSASLSNLQGSYDKTWGRFKSITRPALGNHESSGGGYFDYFNGSGANNGPAGERGKGYYSFDVGAWHLIALNSNCSRVPCGSGSAQEQWLRADLAAHRNTCTLAYWHHPRFSSGHDGDGTFMQAIWQALYNAGADVVLVGHSHDYERFAPQNASGGLDRNRGIREFVVGTGGAFFTGLSTTKPNSEVRQNKTFGVLRLTLRSTSYDWQFVPEPGKTWTDAGSNACH
jgi:hypothetical protein